MDLDFCFTESRLHLWPISLASLRWLFSTSTIVWPLSDWISQTNPCSNYKWRVPRARRATSVPLRQNSVTSSAVREPITGHKGVLFGQIIQSVARPDWRRHLSPLPCAPQSFMPRWFWRQDSMISCLSSLSTVHKNGLFAINVSKIKLGANMNS